MPEKIAETSEQISSVDFDPGQILFNENDQSFHFFIIQQGEVEIFKTSEVGAKIQLAVVGPGASIGEFAMIDRLPRSATAEAVTNVTAIKVSEAAYAQLLSDLPEWAVSVMKSLVERIRNTNDIIRRSQSITPAVRLEIETVEYETDITRIRVSEDHDPLDEVDTPDLA